MLIILVLFYFLLQVHLSLQAVCGPGGVCLCIKGEISCTGIFPVFREEFRSSRNLKVDMEWKEVPSFSPASVRGYKSVVLLRTPESICKLMGQLSDVQMPDCLQEHTSSMMLRTTSEAPTDQADSILFTSSVMIESDSSSSKKDTLIQEVRDSKKLHFTIHALIMGNGLLTFAIITCFILLVILMVGHYYLFYGVSVTTNTVHVETLSIRMVMACIAPWVKLIRRLRPSKRHLRTPREKGTMAISFIFSFFED
jgi:hypothetical protein